MVHYPTSHSDNQLANHNMSMVCENLWFLS